MSSISRSDNKKIDDVPLPWKRRNQDAPRIAVIGGGPVGLEAALYAQRLGYQVWLFEREPEAVPDVRVWAHVSMFTSWSENRTPLGELALTEAARAAKKRDHGFPAPGVYPTGAEFIERYLEPLGKLLGDRLHLETRVVGVGRTYLFPQDHQDDPEKRAARRFRLLTRSPLEERLFTVDYVLDASGRSHTPNWLGAGGLPALGEIGSSRQIFYHIPDILGKDRIHFLGKRTLLVGDGASAATSALLLSEVLRLDSAGSVVWATKAPTDLPLSLMPDDPLPRRDLVFKKANLLIAQQHAGFEHLPLTQVEAVQHSLGSGRFQATLQVDRVTRRTAFDAVIGNVGARPQSQTFERHLFTDEFGFFTLGAKSACSSASVLAESHTQIRDVFRQISGDSQLDLYAQAENALAAQARLESDQEKPSVG